ncbi:rhomboid family intramembrane serine protease [bacterium]|nr:rhomboid family intramembrane serine protease [bacterium]
MGLDSRDYYRPSGMGGFTFFPPIIKALLLSNAAVFFIQLIAKTIFIDKPVSLDDLIVRYFALIPLGGIGIPVYFQNALQDVMSANFYPWQLITYQFMHGSFSHILFNMFALWMFGMEIEHIMGPKKFLLFYLLCGVGAGLLQLFIAPLLAGGVGPTIGASGAVYGVMIAFAMYFPDRYVFIYFLIPIKAKYLIAILFVFEFMSVGDQSLVAHLAHVGGAVTGLFFILYDRKNEFSRKNIFSSFKKKADSFSAGNFKNTFRKNPFKQADVEDAKFYDINSPRKEDEFINQEEIDKILDKISQSGYQNLSEREKRILFEASKKK